ncbi:MAG: nitroreductase family protein [Proteobacteria bacterium]|nr:nitroreductase family protein [Pseudomonadota bacterium]
MNIEEKKQELIRKSVEMIKRMRRRRSVRAFNGVTPPLEVIKNCINIAASAPSGANDQPWTFVLVKDKEIKSIIRKESEKTEKEFYEKRITKEWKDRLLPLNTNILKPFLEEAPYLICIFVQRYHFDENGKTVKHYFPFESVGIATGFLISSLHNLGISSLTYTPSPMNFLKKILGRPKNETPFTILVVGYPKSDYKPPKITKKESKDYLIIK